MNCDVILREFRKYKRTEQCDSRPGKVIRARGKEQGKFGENPTETDGIRQG